MSMAAATHTCGGGLRVPAAASPLLLDGPRSGVSMLSEFVRLQLTPEENGWVRADSAVFRQEKG